MLSGNVECFLFFSSVFLTLTWTVEKYNNIIPRLSYGNWKIKLKYWKNVHWRQFLIRVGDKQYSKVSGFKSSIQSLFLPIIFLSLSLFLTKSLFNKSKHPNIVNAYYFHYFLVGFFVLEIYKVFFCAAYLAPTAETWNVIAT